jgi:hypothetical protein
MDKLDKVQVGNWQPKILSGRDCHPEPVEGRAQKPSHHASTGSAWPPVYINPQ